MSVGEGEIDKFSSCTRVNHAGSVNGVLVKEDSSEYAHYIILYMCNKYSLNYNS